MDGKLLYGAGGNLLPKRLIDGYQDAVFAWSGDYPYANIAQSNVYSIDNISSYNNNWLVKTPYGRGFRAPGYTSSGWIETPSTGTFGEIYSGGITVYCKFVLESQPSSSQFPSYFGLFDKGVGSYYGGIVLGVEYGDASKQRHMFRLGNSATIRYFNNDPAGLNVPVGTLIQAAVTFNSDSRKYTSVYQYKNALHVYSGTSDAGLYMSYGTIIRVGGYARSGNRASQTTSVLEAALWNRPLAEKDLLYLIGRQSVYQERASGLILFGRGGGADIISCSTAALAVSASAAAMVEAGDSVISCSTASLTLTTTTAQQVEVGDSVISCSTASLTLTTTTAQQIEMGDSVVGCTAAALAVSASAAAMVEAGDSVIGCVSASLTLTTTTAQQLEVGDSVVGCTAAALAVSASAAAMVEAGDSVIGCVSASLALTAPSAQQVEAGDSVIGCAATIVSLDGTTATITDSMGVRSAAVVLSTPGCSIHDFDIIGAGQAALVTGSSAAELVESGEAIIYTGYADIGIAAAQCGIVQTDAEPIITDIGLVASIDQPTIYATIPFITIIARS